METKMTKKSHPGLIVFTVVVIVLVGGYIFFEVPIIQTPNTGFVIAPGKVTVSISCVLIHEGIAQAAGPNSSIQVWSIQC